MISFCTDTEQHSSRITNQPTEMELQILHLQRIPSSMFRKPTTEIGHGIDELICDLQEQLHIASATGYDTRTVRHTSSTSGSIRTLGSMLVTRSCIDRRML